MRSLRQAAALLSRAATAEGLVELAAALGFTDTAVTLDPRAREALGIPPHVTDARVVRGAGALRALLVTAPSGVPVRAVLASTATGLAARTSHVLWMLLGASGDTLDAGVGCWTGADRPPRLLALTARRGHVVASDAETLCALEAAAVGDDLTIHARWCELLGREALSARFYHTLEQRVAALGDSLPAMPSDDRAELALLATSRLLFLCFLQTKGWLDGDRAFLVHRFDECMARGGGFHRGVMLPLFFGTLNTPLRDRAPAARRFGHVPFLNGGLFARTAVERRHPRARFTDESLGALFQRLLGAYRFTAREEEGRWSEVAIDPEMLGRAFESLMAARERRVSGAFYTPQALVSHLTDHALASALAGGVVGEEHVRDALADHRPAGPVRVALLDRLRSLTVLDPACGSGAFLVRLLERIASLRRTVGDDRDTAVVRREVLARVIHGVDLNPTAVWLCELRLWLSVVIESPETRMSAVVPLPNLDCNVRVGDSLAGDAFIESVALLGPPAVVVRLRERYVRAAGARKAPLLRALAREERRRAVAALDREAASLAAERREGLLALRSPDLFGIRARSGISPEARARRGRAEALRRERRRLLDGGALPFSFPSHFAHVHTAGGFDLVIGNPPWVRLHNIPAAARATLRARFAVFGNAAWEPQGESTRAHRFGAQVDLAALFVERGIGLTRAATPGGLGGTIALLLPVKLWRSLSGGGVRRLVATHLHLRRVEDWTDAPAAFDAAVYPSIIVGRRRDGGCPGAPTGVVVRRRALDVGWTSPAERLLLHAGDEASPWLLLPPDVRAAFDRVSTRGLPLESSAFGRPALGVKCGCNDAFAVDAVEGDDRAMVDVVAGGRRGQVDRTLLRPLLRGDAMAAWRVPPSSRAILWTHHPDGGPFAKLPPTAARWLAPWRRALRARTDLRGAAPWWMLFRTEGASSARARVVWSDFGRRPRAAVLAAGDPTVPLNSCYVVAFDDPTDALALAALLNGPLAAAWLNAVAEPARGGWRRYLAWTVGLLPLPRDWARARAALAPLAERALLGSVPSDEELFRAACHAYRLRRPEVESLVAWCI